MHDNPYQAPQTHERRTRQRKSLSGYEAIIRAFSTFLVAGSALSILAISFDSVDRTPKLDIAISVSVWVVALAIGYFDYRRAMRWQRVQHHYS
jgi:hypothetical protein